MCKHARCAFNPSRSPVGCPGRQAPGPVAWAAMCGIVAVLRQPRRRPDPTPEGTLGALDDTEAGLGDGDLAALQPARKPLQVVAETLGGTPGLACLLREP